MNSNLFKPGESGNPAGRPKGTPTVEIKHLVEEIGQERIQKQIDKKRKTMTRLEAVVRKLYASALKGNTRSQQIIIERLGGKALMTVAVENPLDREWLEAFKEIDNAAIEEMRTENIELKAKLLEAGNDKNST